MQVTSVMPSSLHWKSTPCQQSARFGSLFDPQRKISPAGIEQPRLDWNPAAIQAINLAFKQACETITDEIRQSPTAAQYEGPMMSQFRHGFVENFLDYAASDTAFLTDLERAGLSKKATARLKQEAVSLPEAEPKSPRLTSWYPPTAQIQKKLPPVVRTAIFKSGQDLLSSVLVYTQLMGHENRASMSDVFWGLCLSPMFGTTAIELASKRLGLNRTEFDTLRDNHFSKSKGPLRAAVKQPSVTETPAKTSAPVTSTALVPVNKPTEPSLPAFVRDLTAEARAGHIRPVYGRDAEITALERALQSGVTKQTLLVGKARTGRTAVIEGLARRIAENKAAPDLAQARVYQLHLKKLITAAKPKEELDNFLNSVKADPNAIVFWDKPIKLFEQKIMSNYHGLMNYLPETWLCRQVLEVPEREFHAEIERDEHLDAPYEKVSVKPLAPETVVQILQGFRDRASAHHRVSYPDPVLKDIVTLTASYLRDKPFPLKAIDVMDKAGIIAREKGQTEVSRADVASVISQMTGIPMGQVAESEKEKLVRLDQILKRRVKGQDDAVNEIVESVILARTGMKLMNGPMGKFVFLGPSGVGKTELAKALAEWMTGSEENLTRIDMTEYMEKHSVSRLIGSPPGYVGFDLEGQLTGAIKRRPYSVILFDEFEKAHPDVQNIMLQLLDDGRLTDGHGRTVDASNTMVIFTSNAGSAEAQDQEGRAGFGFHALSGREEKSQDDKAQEIQSRAIHDLLKPEFVNRLDGIIHFKALTHEIQQEIIRMNLDKFTARLKDDKQMTLTFDPDVLTFLAKELFKPISKAEKRQGGRKALHLLQTHIGKPLAKAYILNQVKEGQTIQVSMNPTQSGITFTPVG